VRSEATHARALSERDPETAVFVDRHTVRGAAGRGHGNARRAVYAITAAISREHEAALVIAAVERDAVRREGATVGRMRTDGEAEVRIAPMPLFGRGGEDPEQDLGPDPVTVWSDAADGWREMPATLWAAALERYRAMPLPERAAEVLARVGPALADSFDKATWKQGSGPRGTEGHSLLGLLIPSARRPDKLSPEQWRAMHELHVTLAEALNALVIARLLINWDEGSGGSVIKYAVSPDGLAALERADVAEVVARRLPD
jgi:hypothetical protein